jgi:hypothetical protein
VTDDRGSRIEDRGRGVWRVLIAATLAATLAACIALQPRTALAQGTAATSEDAAKALKDLQTQLDLARKERLALEARLEKELADEIAARAKGLSMSSEVTALQRLEGLLDSAQSRLLVQRDRIRLLKDETLTTEKAVLVVLVRADAFPSGDVSAVLTVDGAVIKRQTYKPDQTKAIAAGAADELYRADISPAEHKVIVQLAGKGLNANETMSVPVSAKHVTYVEFALKGGKLVTATWTN